MNKSVRIDTANVNSLCLKQSHPKLGRSFSQTMAECRRPIHKLPADGARARTVIQKDSGSMGSTQGSDGHEGDLSWCL